MRALSLQELANRQAERTTKKHARRIAKSMVKTKGDRKLIAKALVKGLIGAEYQDGQADRLQRGNT